MLVVITDKRLGMSLSDIAKAAEPLHDTGIKVVPVAVGNEANPSELEATNPERFVIEAPRDEDPQTLGKQIMEHVVRRKLETWKRWQSDRLWKGSVASFQECYVDHYNLNGLKGAARSRYLLSF